VLLLPQGYAEVLFHSSFVEQTMKIQPYLTFSGNCRAAFTFYQATLGGEITSMMTHGNSPMADQVGPEWREAIMHARLDVGDQVLMGADAPPQYYTVPAGFSVSLSFATAEEAERVFAAFGEGGAVRMPIQETFWAVRFGMLIDRFGTPWIINCDKQS
jgi:PhnB protein